jgi:gas vesicle protein
MQEYPDFTDNANNAKNTGNIAAPLLFGAVIGAGIALLFAPAMGKDTRRRVGHTAKKLGDGARQALERTRDNLNHVTHDAKSAIEKGRQEYMRSRRPEDQPGMRQVPAA